METGTLISVEEYLHTSYRPDCDYVDGVLVERNVGEHDHSRLQGRLMVFLAGLEKSLNIYVLPEMRVQVRPTRFRVPDICVLKGGRPAGSIIKDAPFLCIEILSPEDRMGQMQERIDDYLEMGVRFVWLIDPETCDSYIYTRDRIERCKEGVLRTSDPEIVVKLEDVQA
jgi:Uma2 family endonuclease